MHAVDFLASEGKALDESNKADESVSRRLNYALQYVLGISTCCVGADEDQGIPGL